ncbi:MAG TPA: hypothetical protein VFI00_08935 [Kribbella sp.]|nr:hypothetical protein [Kribbella sp.]
MTTPVDDELLEQLGRVQQAAVRLHAAVRDANNRLTGRLGDVPLEATLAHAIRDLERRVRRLPTGDSRTHLLRWIEEQGLPAADRRTRVMIARVVVADDGTHSLRDDSTGDDFDADYLVDVADQLTEAARTLVSGCGG